MSYRLQHKNKNYIPDGTDVTRWTEEAKKSLGEYSDIISKYNADAVAWRKIAVFSLLLVLVSFGLLIYTVNLPETELVVIGVNDIGETRYYGKTGGLNYEGYEMKAAIINNMLTNYVCWTEDIPNDSQLLYNSYVRARHYLNEDTKRKFDIQVRKEDPFSEVGKIRRNAEIETIIPLSNMSYQVDYNVTETDMQGSGKKVVSYRSIFTLNKIGSKQYNSLSEKERNLNPMGLYIIDMQRVVKNEE